jgi:GT2 family glycosyltransferase
VNYAATVIIPTRNRRDFLRKAIVSSLAQDVPVEVIVLDDASTDDTDAMMAAEFPQVRYERNATPTGPSVTRNRGARMASCEFLFPIDDDAEFVSPATVRQTIADFDHPRIAAVGIPFINVRVGPTVYQHPPDREKTYVVNHYVGAAHALRRSVFLAVGGYREHLFYMGEESDVCIRLLAAGYVTRLGRADVMHHHESPSRDSRRADLFARRNDVLFGWHNVPTIDLPLRWVRAVAGSLRHSAGRGHLLRTIQGLAWGFASVPRFFSKRSAVPRQIYRLQRRLVGRELLLEEVDTELPPITEIPTQSPSRSDQA